MIGAGSTVFMQNLVGDILSEPLLAHSEIALMDIDEKRLATSKTVATRIAEAVGAQPTITATDRRAALDGADYAINMIQVGGYEPGTVIDFEMPKKYGLRQTIADTLGIGGIMRGLRTDPGAARHLPRHGSAARRDLPAVRQPDGDELLGDRPRQQDQDRRPVPQRAGHGRPAGRDIGVPIEEINYRAPASTTWPST